MIDSVKNNVKEYLGIPAGQENDMTQSLKAIVDENTKSIFLDQEKCHKKMKEAGIREKECLRLLLMMKVSGFQELVLRDEKTSQADIDRYVQNALRETGFNRMTVLRLTMEITLALRKTFDYTKYPTAPALAQTMAYVFTPSLYQKDMDQYEREFCEAENAGRLDAFDMRPIENLMAAGVPRAKYYVASYILKAGKSAYADKDLAVRLLHEAAEEGDSKAAVLLGDIYMEYDDADSWSKALEYYTGYGMPGLCQKGRQESVERILNVGKDNKKTLCMSAVLLGLVIASVAFTPAAGIFSAHFLGGILCAVISAVIYGAGVMHYRVKPYDSQLITPGSMLLVWAFYMMIRIVF